jgi:hypothetical protein
MCTLTTVPHEDGFQLGCNRDERLSRPPALPPGMHMVGDTLAAFPIDPTGGGTWIGINEHAVAVGLLNRTVPGDRAAIAAVRCSRGTIARHALGATDLDHALQRITALPLRAFDPFTAVVLHGRSLAAVTSDGHQYRVSARTLEGPALFTSSSLGDDKVIRPRLELFEQSVRNAREPLLMQAPFHRHQWPDCPALSVDMHRPDAATVSRTWITVSGDRATLAYEPVDGESVDLALVLRDTPCRNSPPYSSRPS